MKYFEFLLITVFSFVKRYLVNLFFINFILRMFHQVPSPKSISFMHYNSCIGSSHLQMYQNSFLSSKSFSTHVALAVSRKTKIRKTLGYKKKCWKSGLETGFYISFEKSGILMWKCIIPGYFHNEYLNQLLRDGKTNGSRPKSNRGKVHGRTPAVSPKLPISSETHNKSQFIHRTVCSD